jgi:hypothetical protein
MLNHTPAERAACVPVIHIISDSIGETAQMLARAAAAQFGVSNPHLEVYSKAKSAHDICAYLEERVKFSKENFNQDGIMVMYTLANKELRLELEAWLEGKESIIAVDILTPSVEALSQLSGMQPEWKPGILRAIDSNYFRRIAALEFTIAHDDGRAPEDLTRADIVLLGVSRSSKTPLSIYLAQQGLKVANVPLDPASEPPEQLYQVDRTRLFGLMITPEVLMHIRQKRLKKAAGKKQLVVKDYANMEYVYQDLESSRALMRKLGCIIVRTEDRAVEETAQEILRYYERSHPLVDRILE